MHTIKINGREYLVNLSEWNDFSVIFFTMGNCHSLAYALHKAYGFEMYGVECLDGIIHVICKVDKDLYLDALGLKTYIEIEKFFKNQDYNYESFIGLRLIKDINELMENWGLDQIEEIYTNSILPYVYNKWLKDL